LLAASILIVALVIFWGGRKKADPAKAAADTVKVQEVKPENRADLKNPNKVEMTMKNPNLKEQPAEMEVVPMGNEIPPEELKEGTCEYAAYWFAEYFTSGDTLKVYDMCTDSMKNVVRAIMQTPGQMKTMNLNRAAGYKIETAAMADESSGDHCRACLRASFMNEEKQDCNFHFTKVNGKWLLSGFKEK